MASGKPSQNMTDNDRSESEAQGFRLEVSSFCPKRMESLGLTNLPTGWCKTQRDTAGISWLAFASLLVEAITCAHLA